MNKDNIFFICPKCRGNVFLIENSYKCEYCRINYPIKNWIVCFINKEDSFYEGKYTGTINYVSPAEVTVLSQLYLYFIHCHYLWYINKYINKPVDILDIACGGGTRYLSQKGKVTGLDLSLNSLQKAAQFYQVGVQANALDMPFPDNSFDVITNSFSFEHFTIPEKRILLSQFRRVLKPGGKIILLFDCDNHNPLFNWFKKYPDIYRECFLEHDHHYGLQLAGENLNLFRDAGFKILNYRASNKTPIQHLPVYKWMEQYSKVSKLADLISKASFFIGKFRFTNLGYQVFVTLFDDIIEKFFPLNWARLLLVVLEK